MLGSPHRLVKTLALVVRPPFLASLSPKKLSSLLPTTRLSIFLVRETRISGPSVMKLCWLRSLGCIFNHSISLVLIFNRPSCLHLLQPFFKLRNMVCGKHWYYTERPLLLHTLMRFANGQVKDWPRGTIVSIYCRLELSNRSSAIDVSSSIVQNLSQPRCSSVDPLCVASS